MYFFNLQTIFKSLFSMKVTFLYKLSLFNKLAKIKNGYIIIWRFCQFSLVSLFHLNQILINLLSKTTSYLNIQMVSEESNKKKKLKRATNQCKGVFLLFIFRFLNWNFKKKNNRSFIYNFTFEANQNYIARNWKNRELYYFSFH